MANNADKPFRFLVLPGELRNKVYELLLCSFGEPTSALDDDNIVRQRTISTSLIDTTILRASSQVHREAYDVMVTCTGGLNIDNLLENKRIPTIYTAEAHDSKFECCAMSIVLTCGRDLEAIAMGDCVYENVIVMLAQDLSLLGTGIPDLQSRCVRDGGKVQLHVAIELGPVVLTKPLRYKPCFKAYFSASTQESFLLPLQRTLRDIKVVHLSGHVSIELARKFRAELAQLEWTDPEQTLKDLVHLKDNGREAWKAGDIRTASLFWCDAIMVFRRICCGSSLHPLMTKGCDVFIDQISEIYFLVLLNCMKASFKLYPAEVADRSLVQTYTANIDGLIGQADDLTLSSTSKDGHTWRPSNVHLAKLRYRQAQFYRRPGSFDSVMALRYIVLALELIPDDLVLRKELDSILGL